MNRLKARKDIVYTAILILLGAVLAIRACYSFCWSDESFYLTLPDRFLRGDIPILSEWHPTQFYSVMLLPFAAAYRFFFGWTGVYLFFRILTVILFLAVSIFLFLTLRGWCSSESSFLSACVFLFYCRANISGPSYYNLFVTCLTVSLCLLLRNPNQTGKRRGVQSVFSGCFSALAVLCMPYFAPFLILGILVVFALYSERREQVSCFFLGILLTALIFVLFFLPHDIKSALENLKFILSDPEHDAGALSNFKAAAVDGYYRYRYFTAASCVLSLGILIGRYNPKYRILRPGIAAIMVLEALYAFQKFFTEYSGYAYYALAIILIPWLLEEYLENRISPAGSVFRFVGIAGMLSFALGSNTEIDATTTGMVLYAIGLILQLDCALENKSRDAIVRFSVFCVVGLSLLCTLYSRITVVYRDAPISQLTTRISAGPASGLMTSESHAQEYAGVLAVIEGLNTSYSPENRIFISKLMPWGYLASDFQYGTPTSWRTPISSLRLEQYYSLHPENIPEIVVVLEEHLGNSPDKPAPNENELSGWFWTYMQENNYSIAETDYAKIYIAPSIK